MAPLVSRQSYHAFFWLVPCLPECSQHPNPNVHIVNQETNIPMFMVPVVLHKSGLQHPHHGWWLLWFCLIFAIVVIHACHVCFSDARVKNLNDFCIDRWTKTATLAAERWGIRLFTGEKIKHSACLSITVFFCISIFHSIRKLSSLRSHICWCMKYVCFYILFYLDVFHTPR